LKRNSERILILDVGNYSVKAGFAGDGFPKLIFPSIITKDPEHNTNVVGKLLNIKSDLSSANWIFKDEWDEKKLEVLFEHIFSSLRTDSSLVSVLFAEPSVNSEENRQKVKKILFEKFNISKLLISKQSELILHAMWQRAGLVVDLGHSSTTCIPYYEGFEIAPAIRKTKIGGNTLMKVLNDYITSKGNNFESIYDLPKKMEDLFYIANNFDLEMKFHERGLASKDLAKKMELSDGKEMEFAEERFGIPEILFQPELKGFNEPSLIDIVKLSINSCPIDIRKQLTKNIIIAGGISKLPGLELRLKNEVTNYFPIDYFVRIISHPKREWTAWIGADTLVTKNIPLEQFWSKPT
jgi:actin-related protein